jgi:hypothetical protein
VLVLAFALLTLAVMYAFPSYAVIIGLPLAICTAVDLRTGLVRRARPTD